jgi:hypothetical protein
MQWCLLLLWGQGLLPLLVELRMLLLDPWRRRL